jgi:hypothetical protein
MFIYFFCYLIRSFCVLSCVCVYVCVCVCVRLCRIVSVWVSVLACVCVSVLACVCVNAVHFCIIEYCTAFEGKTIHSYLFGKK